MNSTVTPNVYLSHYDVLKRCPHDVLKLGDRSRYSAIVVIELKDGPIND